MPKLNKTEIRLIVFACIVYLCVGCIKAFCAERAVDVDGIYNSCCRVYNGNTAGSGTCFFFDDEGNAYILTNYHVARTSDCTVQFFPNGEPISLKAQNVWHAYDQSSSLDAVILRVNSSDARNIKNYVPLWTGGDEGITTEECMYSAGCPSAKWLRAVKGRIRKDGNGVVFKPTPYGGQSGSGLIIERNNEPWVGALLTWRTMDEGREDYGGLAQPIKRVLNAMSGNVSNEHNPLPASAIECPEDLRYENKNEVKTGGDEVYVNGVRAWECATQRKYSVEFWHISGCIPCQTVQNSWVPQFKQYADVIDKDGLGRDRYTALQLGISQFPTLRVVDEQGNEIKRYVGASDSYRLAILAIIKQNSIANVVTADAKEVVPASGRFGLYDILPKPGENQPKVEEPKVQPKNEEPKVQPKTDEPKDNGRFLHGIIKNELDDVVVQLIQMIEDAVKPLAKYALGIVYLGCLLALLSYKFVVALLKSIAWMFKTMFKKLMNKLFEIKDKTLIAVAEAVNTQKKGK